MVKNVVVGVTGGIAAYKSCELVRLFKKAGYNVKVIMTHNAKQFIHKNTFDALTENHAYDDLFDDPMLHITLAKWADDIVIAPITAATISKLAVADAQDLLTTVCLATEATIHIAPAMNKIMWANRLLQKNLETLKEQDFKVIMPDSGEQACGDIGYGRMAEPTTIFNTVTQVRGLLHNKTVVITAGGTREKIDPVRFIGNFSSGKMGYAFVSACLQQDAKVILISGPTNLTAPADCEFVAVDTADEMYQAVHNVIDTADIIIAAAAVADYKPVTVSEQKTKKDHEQLSIDLVKTKDILFSIKDKPLFKVGFCAETENLLENAQNKLNTKNLDAIVANLITMDGQPFNADTSTVHYLDKHGKVEQYQCLAKSQIAQNIVKLIAESC